MVCCLRTRNGFKKKYIDKDVRLLAQIDERHDTHFGPAVKRLCERVSGIDGKKEYANLATISVSHLYNLRHSKVYINQRCYFEKTHSTTINDWCALETMTGGQTRVSSH